MMLSNFPFSHSLRGARQNLQYGKSLEIFKKLHINLLLVDGLMKMSKYAKFFKGVISYQKELENISLVLMNEDCSAILNTRDKLP